MQEICKRQFQVLKEMRGKILLIETDEKEYQIFVMSESLLKKRNIEYTKNLSGIYLYNGFEVLDIYPSDINRIIKEDGNVFKILYSYNIHISRIKKSKRS